ncbi:hypothetical protein RZS08_65320, partial [Arthrospira platensis SPKY1]|nr:hypothetical protein [Arthrospira platensis SPKY1]
HVVAASDAQTAAQFAVRRADAQLPPAFKPLRRQQAHLGRSVVVAEPEHPPASGQFGPQAAERVVAGKDSGAFGTQGRQHAPVLPRHRFHTAHEFLMFALGIVDQRHR